jgi:hypothetical protein
MIVHDEADLRTRTPTARTDQRLADHEDARTTTDTRSRSRSVLIMAVHDDRIAWGRLYADEVEHEGADIDTVVRQMAGTEDR